MIKYKDLVDAGAHYGHLARYWNPKMAPYIWGERKGIHLIDISRTADGLEKAAKFLEHVSKEGKTILWIGTKKVAQDAIKTVAQSSQQPYVTHRWIGGTLTNFSQVKKSVTKLLHLEDILAKSANFSYTKKELNTFSKLADRLKKNIGGIVTFPWPIGAIVVVDVRKEQAAIREAINEGIPVVGIVDTNGNPLPIDYVIPSNDDSKKVVDLLVNYLGEAVKKGSEQRAQEEGKKQEREKEEKKITAKVKQEGVSKFSEELKATQKKTEEKTPKKEASKPSATKKEVVVPAQEADPSL